MSMFLRYGRFSTIFVALQAYCMKLFIDYSVFVSVEYLGKSSGQMLLDLTVLKFSAVCKFKHKSSKSAFSKNI